MIVKKKSLVRRFFGFLAFRLFPILIIVAILGSGYLVAQDIFRQFDERSDFNSKIDIFPSAATEIALISTEIPPSDTPIATNTTIPTSTEIPPSITSTLTVTAIPLTDTLEPSSTTQLASNTPVISTNTLAPTLEPTDAIVAPNQFGSTNTPRPGGVYATVTSDPTGQNVFVSTSTPTPSITATETLPAVPTIAPATPTDTLIPPTDVPIVEATQPLPTLLAPLEPPEGLVLNGTAVPTRVPFVNRDYDLVNIVLLGGDDELTDDGSVRTDSIIVVSINRDTGSVKMLSLPRDLFVYIPTPNGAMNRINIVYGVGENIGYTDGGFGLLRQTIWYNLGLNIHFYARVNFSGFQEIIDALDGVDIAVDCAYQDYELIGAEVPEGAVEFGEEGLRTLPIGYYEMDGAQALWYARTRRNSSDFDRGRRQQQLLRAIWQKSLDKLSIVSAPQLWSQLLGVVETDMGLNDFISLIPIALNLDLSHIESYTLTRTYHTLPWQTPAGDFVQLPVYDTLRPLLEDFYRPPTDSQILVEGATIEVFNGTSNADWDIVATDRLGWEGFRSTAMGSSAPAESGETILIDYTGQSKNSSRSEIARILNVRSENILIQPDPDRTADFGVILGNNYTSCDAGVLPVDE